MGPDCRGWISGLDPKLNGKWLITWEDEIHTQIALTRGVTISRFDALI